jgi:hypothetical protein
MQRTIGWLAVLGGLIVVAMFLALSQVGPQADTEVNRCELAKQLFQSGDGRQELESALAQFWGVIEADTSASPEAKAYFVDHMTVDALIDLIAQAIAKNFSLREIRVMLDGGDCEEVEGLLKRFVAIMPDAMKEAGAELGRKLRKEWESQHPKSDGRSAG